MHKIESEKAVINLLYHNPEYYVDINRYVTPKDFHEGDEHTPNTRLVFETLMGMVNEKVQPEVSLWASKSGLKPSYLQKFVDLEVKDNNLEQHLQEIKIATNRRLEKEIGRNATKIIEEHGLEGLQSKLNEVQQNIAEDPETASISSWLDRYVELSYHEAETPIEDRIMKTGLIDLDAAITGLYSANVSLWAGRPGMGKTALMTQILDEISIKDTCAMFMLETSGYRLIDRWLAHRTGFELKEIIERRWVGSAKEKIVHREITNLRKRKLYLFDSKYCNFDLFTKAVWGLAQKNIKLIVADFVQLMYRPNRTTYGNRNQELGSIVEEIARMSNNELLGFPHFALLSQLSRSCESRPDKRPILTDLRDSGELEQDADVVVMIYRDKYYNKDSERVTEIGDIVEVYTEKNRNGEKGKKAELIWRGSDFKFLTMVKHEQGGLI